MLLKGKEPSDARSRGLALAQDDEGRGGRHALHRPEHPSIPPRARSRSRRPPVGTWEVIEPDGTTATGPDAGMTLLASLGLTQVPKSRGRPAAASRDGPPDDAPGGASRPIAPVFDLAHPLGVLFSPELLVSGVRDGSQAALHGVQEGWIARELGGAAVAGREDFEAMLESLRAVGLPEVCIAFDPPEHGNTPAPAESSIEGADLAVSQPSDTAPDGDFPGGPPILWPPARPP